jgi:tryptophan halogenase
MVNRVLVLGGGSAGFLAALTLKIKLPQLHVTVLRSRDIGVIGVGEGTTPNVPRHLFGYLGIDPGELHRLAQPSWKLGIRFLWGKRPFFDYTFGRQTDWHYDALPKNNGYYCDESFEYADISSALMSHDRAFVRQPNNDPLITKDFGYHLENEKFVTYLETKAPQVGIQIVDDTVAQVQQDEHGITGLRLASGGVLDADLYVDCSGFRSVLLGEALKEPYLSYSSTLYCDRALAGGWERTSEPIKPYTTAETMDAGWCWQIEHPTRIIRGYVYSSAFISEKDAEREFRSKNPKVFTTRLLKFPSGRFRSSWVKNVVAIGNASGFVEPLEATSLHVICDEAHYLTQILEDCDRQPSRSLMESYNQLVGSEWDDIRQFLAVHYRYNDRLDTPFWRACRADVDLVNAQPLVDYYGDNGPSTFARYMLLRSTDMFGMEGYLTMLVGQKIPYRKTSTPSTDEWRIWNLIRNEHKTLAQQGLTVREAFAAIGNPNWGWNPGFFRV